MCVGVFHTVPKLSQPYVYVGVFHTPQTITTLCVCGCVPHCHQTITTLCVCATTLSPNYHNLVCMWVVVWVSVGVYLYVWVCMCHHTVTKLSQPCVCGWLCG